MTVVPQTSIASTDGDFQNTQRHGMLEENSKGAAFLGPSKL